METSKILLKNVIDVVKDFRGKDWAYIGGFVVLWVGIIVAQFTI